MKRYFLGLSSNYGFKDTLKHTFVSGSEYDLSELRAFLAAHYGSTYDHVAVYSNGRTALAVALKELVKRGGKVVVTSMTCYAVIQAVKNAGLVPIFADIDKKTLHFGKKELEKAIAGEQNVQAVIVQNNLGIPADIEGIEEVAKLHKLTIIEDLAHSAGVIYNDGREVGTVGRATILSFGKGKSIDAVTGGAVVFMDPLDPPVNQPGETTKFKDNFRARFYPLFSAIIRGGYHINRKIGMGLTAFLIKIHAIKRSADGEINQNLRLTFWQCKLALRQLKSMSHRGRKPIRDFYLVSDRDETLKELAEKGYEFHDIWYETPVAPERYFHKADFHPEACPVAAEVATQIVNVPTWYDKDDLRPALRIIKAHLVEGESISEKELEISEKEKYRQEIETAKKAKKDEVKKAVKAKLSKVAPKEVIKAAKKKKSDVEKKAEEKKEKSQKTKEELEKEKAEKKEKKAEEKKQKELERLEKISEERDDSGLLIAMDKAKEAETKKKKSIAEREAEKKQREKELEKETAEELKIIEEVEKENQKEGKKSSKETDEEPAKLPEKTVEKNKTKKLEKEVDKKPEPTVMPKTSNTTSSYSTMRQPAKPLPPKPQTASMPGMRVAPEKLSERDRLKQELEQGKREDRSVV